MTKKEELNYRDEDFYKTFSKLYMDITLNNKAPWTKEGIPERGIAYNPSSGVVFGGINSLILEMRSAQKGYKDSRWLSFDEIEKLGLKVKTGEIATPIAYINKYSPPVNVNPSTGEKFTSATPSQSYYFMYNVSQLKDFELTNDKEFIIGKDFIAEKARNAAINSNSKDLREVTQKLIDDVVKAVPPNMREIAAGISQYRMAQELHVPYRPILRQEQLDTFKTAKVNLDELMKTCYQAEVSKNRLFSKEKQLESGITRTVNRTNQNQIANSKGMEI